MGNLKHAHWSGLHRAINTLLLAALAAPTATAQMQQQGPSGNPRQVQPPAHGEALYLQVVLNATPQPQLMHFQRSDGRFFASAADLKRLGFAIDTATDGETLPLDGIPGLQARYDALRQRLLIDAPLSVLALPTTRLNQPDQASPTVTAPAPGMVLNYDLYASQDGDNSQLSVGTDLRVFGLGNGVFNNSSVSRGHRNGDGGWQGESVRLDSRWQWSFPASAVTVTLGDTFTGFLSRSRPVRIGGVQIGRNFALQPYRITSPLPTLLGEAVVPSSVELYVNGMRQYSGEVPAGPFQLTTIPGISGAGTAHLVVTDAFGRVRMLDVPFYASQELLAEGLSDWSVSAGVVRRDYGLRSFAYASDPVISGNYRRGINDHFTFESHAEAGGNVVNAGIGGAWLLGRAGVIGLSHAVSHAGSLRGSQSGVAYNWNNSRFNISLDSQRTHGDYRDIAALDGPLPPSISERALLGVITRQFGQFSVSHVRLAYPADRNPHQTIRQSRYAGLYWTRRFATTCSVYFSYNRNLDDDRDENFHLGASIPLGRDRQASVSWQRNAGRDSAVVDVTRSIPGEGGFGWRLQARSGNASGGMVEAGWLNDRGRYSLGVAQMGGASHGYAQASGALVHMDGHTFIARDIDDAFAVVSTDGIVGVPVKLENRVIGYSNGNGVLLVSRLNAWQRNKLSIDPMDLPANLRVTDVDLLVTPGDRAGIRARFRITPVRAAIVILHDGAGSPLPLGSRVTVEGMAGVPTIVGYDGEAYLEALQARNRLHVETPNGVCHAGIDYPGAADGIPRLGPVACLLEPDHD